MNDQEIRIVMAEACGVWTVLVNDGECFQIRNDRTSAGCGGPANHISVVLDKAGVPDYPNDLNAVHEAEKSIYDNVTKRMAYFLCLGLICDTPIKTVMATARQRCEAFIKTVCPEKWIP